MRTSTSRVPGGIAGYCIECWAPFDPHTDYIGRPHGGPHRIACTHAHYRIHANRLRRAAYRAKAAERRRAAIPSNQPSLLEEPAP